MTCQLGGTARGRDEWPLPSMIRSGGARMVMAIIIGFIVAGATENALAGIGTAVVLTIMAFVTHAGQREY